MTIRAYVGSELWRVVDLQKRLHKVSGVADITLTPLEDLWQRTDRWRWLAAGALVVSLGMFIHFYPILSAAKLCCGRSSFEYWMWLRSWR